MKKTILATVAMRIALVAPASAQTDAAFVACANEEAARSGAQVESDRIGYAAITCVGRHPASARIWCDHTVGKALSPDDPTGGALGPLGGLLVLGTAEGLTATMACPQVMSKPEIEERINAYREFKANEINRFCAENPSAGMCEARRRAEQEERERLQRVDQQRKEEAARRAEAVKREAEESRQKALEARCRSDPDPAECRPLKEQWDREAADAERARQAAIEREREALQEAKRKAAEAEKEHKASAERAALEREHRAVEERARLEQEAAARKVDEERIRQAIRELIRERCDVGGRPQRWQLDWQQRCSANIVDSWKRGSQLAGLRERLCPMITTPELRNRLFCGPPRTDRY